MADNSAYILNCEGISKAFGGTQALKDVQLHIKPGEVHALLGENGAGKSTLMKCVIGLIKPDEGKMDFDGKPYSASGPVDALKSGISMVHQELNPEPYLTVAESIFLKRENVRGFLLDKRAQNKRCDELLSKFQVAYTSQTMMKDLTLAQIQMVEIIKAVSCDAKLIILDEPTSSLDSTETDHLFDTIRDLKSKGVAIIYISHRMEEIFEICDRVSVFRDGSYISTSIVSETNRKTLIADMVGRQMGEAFPERGKGSREVIMEIRHLSNRRIHDVSLKLHRGEILGVGGLVGAGRTELLRAIYGADEIWEGEIMLNGETVTIASPAAALKYSIALLPEDRKQQGVVMGMSIGHNISLAILDRLSSFTVIRKKLEKELCSGLVKELAIKLSSLKSPVKTLSGGNQQKVVLAKCLATNCDILFIDEPTRGIDVGAKQEIYRIMRKLADQGTSILMVSSEMSELIGMSDRIIVMKEGQVAGELEPEAYSQETILNYAAL